MTINQMITSFLLQDQDLEDNCNAPDDGIGIYIVYRLKEGKVMLTLFI